jgi:hypothetical protein
MIEQIDNGIHQLMVSYEGYVTTNMEIEITSENLTEVEFNMIPASAGEENNIANLPLSFGKIYPNPFIPKNSRQGVGIEVLAEQAELTIYDIKGRKIRILPVENAGTVFWDGVDNLGNQVASGIYLLRLQSDEDSANTRLMLVK